LKFYRAFFNQENSFAEQIRVVQTSKSSALLASIEAGKALRCKLKPITKGEEAK
jgi:hypothetical protein